jgi:serine phosphatase RsbU (regulator of sigma subunit)
MTPAVADMLRAKMIQQTCLECALAPDDRVKFDVRYTPTDIVGGDYYRVERTDTDHYAILVADVMGHGMASALYAVQLRSLWEDLRGNLNSPTAFLTELNKRLCVLSQGTDYFATALCASLNVADGTLTFASAGHMPPLILQRDGLIKRYTDGQPALGVFRNVGYADRVEQLEHGDTAFLFTDGAIEITNVADQDLGIQGLIKLIQANIAGSKGTGLNLPRLEEQLLYYSNRIHLPDDLTLLTACRL